MDDFEKTELFGIDIVKLYDCKLIESYDLVSKNTEYLNGIPIEEVKQIKFSCYKDIIILLKNGNVLFNGEKKLENIRTLGFMSGISIFAFSNENIITCLTGEWESVKFLNNNDYKYKKIIITPLIIVALNYEKELKVFGTLCDEAVDYTRFSNVDDIGYCAEEDEVVIVKDNEVQSLFMFNTNNIHNESKIIFENVEEDGFAII